ncbi:RRXRR domain-containing protein, partial [Streptomonospora sp. PA3]
MPPHVFVLDTNRVPLQPCHPARARQLLDKGRAVVHRRTPFTIRLKDRTVENSEVDGVDVGIDPGSKHTGVAVFTARGGERRGRF